MKKNVFVFSRLAPEHLERLQCQFNVRVLEPKQGDIDAQYAAALPDTHGMIGVGRPLGARQLEQAMQLEVILRESEINQEGKARKLWDIEEGKGI